MKELTDDLYILVVEDDPAHVELIRYAFAEAGSPARIAMVPTLAEYRQQLRHELPDLVLMDLNLPDGSALKVLNDNAGDRSFPILIMTAKGDELQAVAAMKAGVLDYLVKSDTAFAQMPHTIERALREWRLLQQQRQMAAALTRSQERYRHLYQQFLSVFEGIVDPLLLVDGSLRIEWANQAALTLLEREADTLKEMTFLQLLKQNFLLDNGALPRPQELLDGTVAELQLDGGDGRVWNVRVLPIREPEGGVNRTLLQFHDVAEKIKSQSDAIRASQLAVLGELAAGVAHEINNPVNGIINYAQILVNRLQADERNRDVAGRIIHEGNRIATIVGNLLAFARPQEEQRQPVCLQETLADCLALAAAQLRQNEIGLRTRLAEDLPPVMGVKSQLQQVFLNLISNARYALNEKYPAPHPDKTIDIAGDVVAEGDGTWVRLTFTDYGTGISKADLVRVLHPFFTTKPVNAGTGLGLSISHGIIKNHRGRFVIDSVHGESTRVSIDLPLPTGEAA